MRAMSAWHLLQTGGGIEFAKTSFSTEAVAEKTKSIHRPAHGQKYDGNRFLLGQSLSVGGKMVVNRHGT